MQDPEDILREARLSVPSDALESRMQRLFAGAARPDAGGLPGAGCSRHNGSGSFQLPNAAARPRGISTWWWMTVGVAAAVIATFTFIENRPIHRPVTAVLVSDQCNIEPQGLMRSMLLEPSGPENAGARFSVSVSSP